MRDLKELLSNTFDYISECNDERKGHHVYVVNQAALNSTTPLSKMTEERLLAFDLNMALKLKISDLELKERVLIEVSNISVFNDIAEIVDIYGQGCNEPTGKGVDGFQVDMDINVFVDGSQESFHVVLQNLDRSDGIMAYSGVEMTTASKYGCDDDGSDELFEALEQYDDLDEFLKEIIESSSVHLCNAWFELNSDD